MSIKVLRVPAIIAMALIVAGSAGYGIASAQSRDTNGQRVLSDRFESDRNSPRIEVVYDRATGTITEYVDGAARETREATDREKAAVERADQEVARETARKELASLKQRLEDRQSPISDVAELQRAMLGILTLLGVEK